MKKKLTTEMARYIWSIIAHNPSLPMSWGVDLESLGCTDNAIEFHVQGFIHTGNVRIVYIEGADLFQVSLYDEEGKRQRGLMTCTCPTLQMSSIVMWRTMATATTRRR